jgi:hypothetical protein
MSGKGPRPCCICGMEFEGYGHNPEPFDGDIGMCCDDCNDRWVVPVRILFGRDGLDRFVPKSGAPLELFKKLAEMGASCAVNTKAARAWLEAEKAKINEANPNP